MRKVEKELFNKIAEAFGFKNKYAWCIRCEEEKLADMMYNPKTNMCRKCEVEVGDEL